MREDLERPMSACMFEGGILNSGHVVSDSFRYSFIRSRSNSFILACVYVCVYIYIQFIYTYCVNT